MPPLDAKRGHKDPQAYQKLRYLAPQYAAANPAKHGLVVVGLGLASDEGGQVTESSEVGFGTSSRSSMRPGSPSMLLKSPELDNM